ncbi:MAG TPA: hypothetical protein VES68_01610, partial [Candidatus Sulfotelmatobacter sp.]|nr:hypothetical protein [Candidatus Sulfotelmatobacter sp.]
MKKLPPITKAEHNILKLLLKFRFSTPAHIQKYFKHQDFKRTYEWLNDLKAKGYINSIRINKFITSPTVYCLATKSKYILKDEKTL